MTDLVHPSRVPGLRHAFAMWRRLRGWLSRREWTVRLLGLPLSRGTSEEPGLILLQIDGLSRREMERACRSGKLPFLKRLIEREQYRTHTFYSGLPATTPAVLGELLYGVPQVVPAFGFLDHRTGQIVQMFQPGVASTIQDELRRQGEGLLEGGSAYCTIFSGGAAEAQFCPSNLGWESFTHLATWKKIAIFLLNIVAMIRIVGLSLLELAVACYDATQGRIARAEFKQELYYIPRRVVVAVVLRELVAIGAEADAIRGLPAIHANFLGYDEQAHRRGPASAFAHFSLRDIDRSLRRIWNAAHASRRRDYRVWVFSDHGQETTVPFDRAFGRTVQDAVAEVYRSRSSEESDSAKAGRPLQPRSASARAAWFRKRQATDAPSNLLGGDPPHDRPAVIAIGPLGYIHWPERITPEQVESVAVRLTTEAKVPLVVARVGDRVSAWTRDGRFEMPAEADRVLSADHPHLSEAANDLAKLASHPDGGDFVISGWRREGLPISFVTEHGSHGGPGPVESSGFALLPPDAPDPPRGKALRPSVLREMARSTLGKEISEREPRRDTATKTIRIVSYNIHTCLGLDGRLSPSRIARVLATLSPDIIALQEVDVLRKRSGSMDQAQKIAAALEMKLCFHSSFNVADEKYGNAVLSRFPLEIIRSGTLPSSRPNQEPRSALWVKVDVAGHAINVMNTHLGLSSAERLRQVDALLGDEWIENARCQGPVILCGDFNASPRSPVYKRLTARLRDAQQENRLRRPQRTWFSPLPLARIDHVFVSPGLSVLKADVLRTQLSSAASDHLPLYVDVQLPTG